MKKALPAILLAAGCIASTAGAHPPHPANISVTVEYPSAFPAGGFVDLAVDYDYTYVYLLNQTDNEYEYFDYAGGSPLSYLSVTNPAEGYPVSMALGPDASDLMYFAEDSGKVLYFDLMGNPQGEWGPLSSTLAGIAVDDDGTVAVTTSSPVSGVQTFDGAGNPGPSWTGGLSLASHSGLAFDGDGNIYVADTNNNRIQKFDPSGNPLLEWGTAGTGNGQFSLPEDVSVGPYGNVYVADTGNDRIQIFEPDGTFIIAYGSTGSGSGQFNSPTAVEARVNHRIFVVDSGNARIQRLFYDFVGPDPDLSTVPQAIPLSIDGSLEYSIEIDSDLGPVSGATVEVTFDPAASALIAWNPSQTLPVSGVTDMYGQVSFFLKGAGCLDPSRYSGVVARVTADGVDMATPYVISPDVVNSSYQLATELGMNICEGGETRTDMADAVWQHDPIAQGLPEACSDFTAPFGDGVNIEDVVIMLPYIAQGTFGPCN